MALFLGEHSIDLFAGQPVKSDEETILDSLTATPTTSTQTFLPSSSIDGWNRVTVNPIPNQYIIPTGSTNITQNGVFDISQYASATVDVPGIIPSGTISITSNNTYDVTNYAGATVNVPTGSTINNQNKTVTPTESEQSITADNGYTGLGTVTVEAIDDTYVGSAVSRRSSSNLTASGATVTAPAGYYEISATKTISSGSATTPTTSITANPSISIDEDGLITSTVSGSKSITPTISTGYISSGTAGTVSVTGSKTEQLSTQSAVTITPSTSAQTAVTAGKYTTGAITVAAMPTGTAGTPTASKGTVSSHSINITPSVTNVTGYITGGTKNGTAVTVSASELVSGTKSISANGTGIDVTNYASVDVNVPSSVSLQQKQVTPTESIQNITADSGYDGLSSVEVGAISSTYVGSGIAQKSSNDLTVSGGTVTAPAGYYSANASKSVASMTLPTSAAASATTGYTSKATISRSTSTQYINIPTGYNSTGGYYTISATPNGSVTAPSSISGTSASVSTGTNTLTLTKTVSVTPNVTTAGYISSGTAGNSSVSLTASVTTKGAATITPGTSNQTISSGTYLTGTQTISGDSDLVAGNIKTGTSIFNVTGTYTSDATAAASDIISDKTAYVNGSKITGSLVVQKYYTGSGTPASSLGSNGDLYVQQ